MTKTPKPTAAARTEGSSRVGLTTSTFEDLPSAIVETGVNAQRVLRSDSGDPRGAFIAAGDLP